MLESTTPVVGVPKFGDFGLLVSFSAYKRLAAQAKTSYPYRRKT
jgi:hypothetical protein